jgi:hypothetical protein
MSAEAVWVGWLVLFLVYEIVAAVSERGKPSRLTLSRNVWAWFDTPFRKVVLAVFMLTLTSHLVLRQPGGLAVILTGIPVVLVIGLAVCRRPVVGIVLALPLLMGTERCKIELPQPSPSPTVAPTPTPEPTPTPTPEPTPTPAPQTCANHNCDPDYVCEDTPTGPRCVPKDDCDVPLNGSAVMGASKHGVRVYDTTPKITNAERCKALGMDRITCPVVSECPGIKCEQRYACELKLMGGYPQWELVVNSGELRWVYDEDPPWKARILGNGTGKLRSCYANGRACSPWLDVSY